MPESAFVHRNTAPARARGVQANDVLRFSNEVCIVGKFERLNLMRLESVSAPDAGNDRSARAQVSSQGARAPVRLERIHRWRSSSEPNWISLVTRMALTS